MRVPGAPHVLGRIFAQTCRSLASASSTLMSGQLLATTCGALKRWFEHHAMGSDLEWTTCPWAPSLDALVDCATPSDTPTAWQAELVSGQRWPVRHVLAVAHRWDASGRPTPIHCIGGTWDVRLVAPVLSLDTPWPMLLLPPPRIDGGQRREQDASVPWLFDVRVPVVEQAETGQKLVNLLPPHSQPGVQAWRSHHALQSDRTWLGALLNGPVIGEVHTAGGAVEQQTVQHVCAWLDCQVRVARLVMLRLLNVRGSVQGGGTTSNMSGRAHSTKGKQEPRRAKTRLFTLRWRTWLARLEKAVQRGRVWASQPDEEGARTFPSFCQAVLVPAFEHVCREEAIYRGGGWTNAEPWSALGMHMRPRHGDEHATQRSHAWIQARLAGVELVWHSMAIPDAVGHAQWSRPDSVRRAWLCRLWAVVRDSEWADDPYRALVELPRRGHGSVWRQLWTSAAEANGGAWAWAPFVPSLHQAMLPCAVPPTSNAHARRRPASFVAYCSLVLLHEWLASVCGWVLEQCAHNDASPIGDHTHTLLFADLALELRKARLGLAPTVSAIMRASDLRDPVLPWPARACTDGKLGLDLVAWSRAAGAPTDAGPAHTDGRDFSWPRRPMAQAWPGPDVGQVWDEWRDATLLPDAMLSMTEEHVSRRRCNVPSMAADAAAMAFGRCFKAMKKVPSRHAHLGRPHPAVLAAAMAADGVYHMNHSRHYADAHDPLGDGGEQGAWNMDMARLMQRAWPFKGRYQRLAPLWISVALSHPRAALALDRCFWMFVMRLGPTTGSFARAWTTVGAAKAAAHDMGLAVYVWRWQHGVANRAHGVLHAIARCASDPTWKESEAAVSSLLAACLQQRWFEGLLAYGSMGEAVAESHAAALRSVYGHVCETADAVWSGFDWRAGSKRVWAVEQAMHRNPQRTPPHLRSAYVCCVAELKSSLESMAKPGGGRRRRQWAAQPVGRAWDDPVRIIFNITRSTLGKAWEAWVEHMVHAMGRTRADMEQSMRQRGRALWAACAPLYWDTGERMRMLLARCPPEARLRTVRLLGHHLMGSVPREVVDACLSVLRAFGCRASRCTPEEAAALSEQTRTLWPPVAGRPDPACAVAGTPGASKAKTALARVLREHPGSAAAVAAWCDAVQIARAVQPMGLAADHANQVMTLRAVQQMALYEGVSNPGVVGPHVAHSLSPPGAAEPTVQWMQWFTRCCRAANRQKRVSLWTSLNAMTCNASTAWQRQTLVGSCCCTDVCIGHGNRPNRFSLLQRLWHSPHDERLREGFPRHAQLLTMCSRGEWGRNGLPAQMASAWAPGEYDACLRLARAADDGGLVLRLMAMLNAYALMIVRYVAHSQHVFHQDHLRFNNVGAHRLLGFLVALLAQREACVRKRPSLELPWAAQPLRWLAPETMVHMNMAWMMVMLRSAAVGRPLCWTTVGVGPGGQPPLCDRVLRAFAFDNKLVEVLQRLDQVFATNYTDGTLSAARAGKRARDAGTKLRCCHTPVQSFSAAPVRLLTRQGADIIFKATSWCRFCARAREEEMVGARFREGLLCCRACIAKPRSVPAFGGTEMAWCAPPDAYGSKALRAMAAALPCALASTWTLPCDGPACSRSGRMLPPTTQCTNCGTGFPRKKVRGGPRKRSKPVSAKSRAKAIVEESVAKAMAAGGAEVNGQARAPRGPLRSLASAAATAAIGRAQSHMHTAYATRGKKCKACGIAAGVSRYLRAVPKWDAPAMLEWVAAHGGTGSTAKLPVCMDPETGALELSGRALAENTDLPMMTELMQPWRLCNAPPHVHQALDFDAAVQAMGKSMHPDYVWNRVKRLASRRKFNKPLHVQVQF